MEEQGRRRCASRTGPRALAPRAATPSPDRSKQTPGAIGLHRAHLRADEQDQLRFGAESRRQVRRRRAPSRSALRPRRQPGKMPADFRVSIANADGDAVYPLSSFTWLLLYQDPKDKAQAKAMVEFVKWAAAGRTEVRAGYGIRAAAEGGGRSRSSRRWRRSRLSRWPESSEHPSRRSDVPRRDGCVRRSCSSSASWRSASSCTVSRGSRCTKFGWQFWQTDTWDPVAGQFGARPFIWGTLYSSVLAILISTPIALGIAIYISELAPSWSRRAAGLPD